jgi:DNA adenine methylase
MLKINNIKMRYFGGKARIGKEIANFINNNLKENQTYVEPFVGGAWIMYRINNERKRIGSDLCKPLIDLYCSMQNSWIPPTNVDKELYMKGKKGELDSNLTAFLGFGCSFAGKWYGGFASTEGRNYAMNAKNSLMKKFENLSDVIFLNQDYTQFTDMENCFIYCDPPYGATTKYDYCGHFDTNKFWNIMRKWSEKNTVIVSEYTAPPDFKYVLEIETKTDIRNKNNNKEKRIEKIFSLNY